MLDLFLIHKTKKLNIFRYIRFIYDHILKKKHSSGDKNEPRIYVVISLKFLYFQPPNDIPVDF